MTPPRPSTGHPDEPEAGDQPLTHQLRATLSARAQLAPTPEMVHRMARTTITRRARRRRWAAAGGVAASVLGLGGGLMTIASPGQPQTSPAAPPTVPDEPSTPSTTTTPTGPPLPTSTESCPAPDASAPQDLLAATAFTTAGYTTDDAWYLATFWDLTCTAALIQGGAAVQAGQLLPVAPGASPPHYDTLTGAGPAAQQTFSQAGYTAEDASALAALWGYADPAQAASKAGLLVDQGQTVPIEVARQESAAAQARIETFYNAGYTYDDAQALAQLWASNVDTAKTRGGADLLAGRALPIPPSSTTD